MFYGVILYDLDAGSVPADVTPRPYPGVRAVAVVRVVAVAPVEAVLKAHWLTPEPYDVLQLHGAGGVPAVGAGHGQAWEEGEGEQSFVFTLNEVHEEF